MHTKENTALLSHAYRGRRFVRNSIAVIRVQEGAVNHSQDRAPIFEKPYFSTRSDILLKLELSVLSHGQYYT